MARHVVEREGLALVGGVDVDPSKVGQDVGQVIHNHFTVIFFDVHRGTCQMRTQNNIVQQKEVGIILNQLQKAADLNPYETKYYLSLAQGYSTQALLTASQPEASTEQVQQQTQKVIDSLN